MKESLGNVIFLSSHTIPIDHCKVTFFSPGASLPLPGALHYESAGTESGDGREERESEWKTGCIGGRFDGLGGLLCRREILLQLKLNF